MRHLIPAALAALALAVPASAGAHVTVQPDTAPAGGFARLDVRVPNERDDAGTVKVDVQMPPGFVFASYEPVPGWSVKITKEKLDQPIEIEGLEMNEQISRITWTGHPKQGGIIAPGQFQDFGLSVGIPDGKPGAEADLQGAADLPRRRGRPLDRTGGRRRARTDRHPHLRRRRRAATAPPHRQPPTKARHARPPLPPRATGRARSGSDGLAIAALIVGALGLLAGVAGLLTARRTQTRPTA